MTSKRRRGRPQGSGKNDTSYLVQVADFMVADPKLKATTAMKRVIATRKVWDESEETLLRRWQVKWKAEKTILLAAAKERKECKPVSGGGYMHGDIAVNRGFEGGAVARAMRDLDRMQRMKDLMEPPYLRYMRELERKTRDLVDPPYLRQIREQERMIRDLVDPPYLRALKGLL